MVSLLDKKLCNFTNSKTAKYSEREAYLRLTGDGRCTNSKKHLQ